LTYFIDGKNESWSEEALIGVESWYNWGVVVWSVVGSWVI